MMFRRRPQKSETRFVRQTFLDLCRKVSQLLPHPCLRETADRILLEPRAHDGTKSWFKNVVSDSLPPPRNMPTFSPRGEISRFWVLWCLVLNPHRRSPYPKLLWCGTRYATGPRFEKLWSLFGVFRGACLNPETTLSNQLLILFLKCGLRFSGFQAEHHPLGIQVMSCSLVLWFFVLNPHRRSPYSKFPF